MFKLLPPLPIRISKQFLSVSPLEQIDLLALVLLIFGTHLNAFNTREFLLALRSLYPL